MSGPHRRTALGIVPVLASLVLILALAPLVGLFRLFARCSSPIPLAILTVCFVSLLLVIATGIGLFGWISAVALLGAVVSALSETKSVVKSSSSAGLPEQGYRW